MMTCLIVDDEPLAQDVIEHHLGKIDFLSLKGKCSNAFEALVKINSEQIDVLFLDIKMPEMSGIEFIKSIKQVPKIILTTAFSDYALEGYELEIVDYLLKPISFERFLKAVNKLKQSTTSDHDASRSNEGMKNELFIKSDRKLIKIDAQDILFIEGLKNYLMIYTNTPHKRIITHSTFKNMEDELSGYSYFQRVHKSFIVNLNHLSVIEGNSVHIGSHIIPIGSMYKENFIARMKK